MNSRNFKNLFKRNHVLTDVVGLEIGAGVAQGVPAVRLRRQNEKVEVVAAGFLDLKGDLPETHTAAEIQPVWQLPGKFAAPHAALALTSTLGVIRHATGAGEDIPEKKQMMYREIDRSFGSDVPPLLAAMPDFQASWAAKLLPEGRRPTACSLQLTSLAAMNCFQRHATCHRLEGGCIVLFVFQSYTAMVAFHSGIPLLYREHPLGALHIQQEIASRMQMDVATVNQFMEDASVDLSLIFESVLRPLYRQVEIISDYVSRRRNTQVSRYYLAGAVAGEVYWISVFKQIMQGDIDVFRTFSDLLVVENEASVLVDRKSMEPLLLGATGAALAALEVVEK